MAFRHPQALEEIVVSGMDPARKNLFEEILFIAAFIANARKILSRSGIDAAETARLSEEFAGELGRLPGLLNRLVHASEDVKTPPAWNPENSVQMAGFLELCGDLAILHAFDRDRPEGRSGRRQT
jgi:hypothetical protein